MQHILDYIICIFGVIIWYNLFLIHIFLINFNILEEINNIIIDELILCKIDNIINIILLK